MQDMRATQLELTLSLAPLSGACPRPSAFRFLRHHVGSAGSHSGALLTSNLAAALDEFVKNVAVRP